MTLKWRTTAVVACCVAVACGKTPQPPTTESSPQTIQGHERIGWEQAAADAQELSTFGYAIYVDDVRSEVSGASCSRSFGVEQFSCAAPLPPLSPGTHKLELATFVADGSGSESPRSSPLFVNVVPSGTAATSGAQPAAARQPTVWPVAQPVVTQDGTRLRLQQIADGLADPNDLAFLPDGRALIAESEGRIRVLRDGRLLPEPALTLERAGTDGERLLSLAADPRFGRTHFVYAIYTDQLQSGEHTFSIARFREASDTLADRIVLRDDVRASRDAAAALRFGADGTLFAAFDDAGIAQLRGDLASPNGKVLRLNPDGTTPADQAGGTPLYSYAYRSPRGLDWHPTANTLWVADRDSPSSGRLNVVAPAPGPRKRGQLQAALQLPDGTLPSSLAFYRGDRIPAIRDNLLVASEEGRHLLRIQLDPNQPTRIVATERLLQDEIGGIRLVAAGPDGAIYLATATTLGRLIPMER
jgi:glucose/arabinose dehydrogenase